MQVKVGTNDTKSKIRKCKDAAYCGWREEKLHVILVPNNQDECQS
jgi:hypothetical protein